MNAPSLPRIIWEYLLLNQPLEKADCIVGMGSHDIRVAERSAELFLDGWAPLLVFTGYLGRLTSGVWDRPEAEIFAEQAVKMGVPWEKILIENWSTNTGENVRFTRNLLLGNGMNPRKIIAVHKPYMERRTYATFKKLWPEPELIVASPRLSFENYCFDKVSQEKVIHIMVGDLQRILLYPEMGYQIPQEVPNDVIEAYQQLVKAGYTRHLVNHSQTEALMHAG